MLKITQLFLLLLVAPLVAHADEAPMFAEQAGTHGFLFEVVPKGSSTAKLFLYGTLHVGTEAVTPFTHAVKQSLRASAQLALEVDPSDVGGMARLVGPMVMYPADDSLERHVPAATLAELKKVLPRYKLAEATVMRMRLWMVGMMLGLAEAELLGYKASFGTENFLAAYAKTHGMPIVEVEGAEAQLKIIGGEPEAVQLAALVDGLQDLASGKSTKKLHEIVTMWTSSDPKTAEALLREAHTSKRPSERAFAKHLLDDRNLTMIARAEEYLRGPKTTFMAVGSLHLFGPQGLVALLRKRGYELRELR